MFVVGEIIDAFFGTLRVNFDVEARPAIDLVVLTILGARYE